jgi:hypothetical protein
MLHFLGIDAHITWGPRVNLCPLHAHSSASRYCCRQCCCNFTTLSCLFSCRLWKVCLLLFTGASLFMCLDTSLCREYSKVCVGVQQLAARCWLLQGCCAVAKAGIPSMLFTCCHCHSCRAAAASQASCHPRLHSRRCDITPHLHAHCWHI